MTALGATVDAVDVGSAELVFESSPQHEVIVSTKRTLTLRRRWYHSTFGFCLERTHSLNCGWELSSHSHLLDTPHLGIRVLTVETDGPASLAGVQPQDVITHVNDTAVRTLSTIEAFHHVRDDGDILMLCVGRTERFDPSDLHTTFTAPSDLESHTLDLELPQTEGGQGTPFHLVPHIEIGAEGQPWTMQALVSSVGDRQCDVRSGDLISGVDGVDVETMSLEQLQTTINDRCATGPLKLRVVRYGAEPLATSQFHVSIHKSEEEPLGFRLASTFRSDSRADRLAASQSGLRVLSMTQGGPADIAGIRVDDVVTEISGVTVRELATEEEAFQRMRASGSVLDLAVYRVTELKEAETELPPHFTPPVTADRPLAIQVTRHDSSHVLPFTIVPHVEAPLAAGATRMLPVILVTENWKCRLRTGDTVLSLSTLTGTPLDVTGMNLRQVQDWMEREWCVNDGVRLNVLRFHSGPRGQPVSDEIKPEYSTLFLLGILALVIFSLAISAYCLFGVALVDVPLALHPKLPPVVSLLSLSNASLISSKVQAFAVGKIVYHFGWLPTNDIRNATAKELYSELNPHNPLALPPPYLHLSKLVLDIHGNGATCELNATAFDQCLTCNIPWPSDTMEGQFCEGHVLSRILGALSCHLVAGVVFCIGLYQKWRGKQPFHNDKFLQSGWVLGWNFCGLTAVVMFAMLYVWGAITFSPDTTRSALFPTGGESHGDLYSTPGYCTMLPFMMLIAFWLTTHYLKLLWFRAPTTSDYESDPLLPSYTPFADEEDDQDQDDHRLEVYSPPGLHHGVTPQPSLPGPSSIEMTQIGSRDMR